jgi:hypothetical protein
VVAPKHEGFEAVRYHQSILVPTIVAHSGCRLDRVHEDTIAGYRDAGNHFTLLETVEQWAQLRVSTL